MDSKVFHVSQWIALSLHGRVINMAHPGDSCKTRSQSLNIQPTERLASVPLTLRTCKAPAPAGRGRGCFSSSPSYMGHVSSYLKLSALKSFMCLLTGSVDVDFLDQWLLFLPGLPWVAIAHSAECVSLSDVRASVPGI